MRPVPALAAAVLSTFALGSIHAFSVFVAPLEEALAAGRDSVSLAYGIALLALTAAVLVGPRWWRLAPPAAVAGLSLLAAAGGLALAGQPALWALYLGYGALFGFANGSGYGFALVVASHALPERRGIAMGAVTAAYALGAMAAAWPFTAANAAFGHDVTLALTAGLFVLLGLAATLLLHVSRLAIGWPATAAAPREGGVGGRETALLWAGFGAGGMAGLMVLGHAAEILRAHGGGAAAIAAGVMLATAANAAGGLVAGWLADRGQLRRLLLGLPMLAAASLVALTAIPGPAAAIALLALVELSYGGIIVLYPVAVTRMAGPALGPVVYGRVFTCWGVAGFAGPWLAGLLFEATGGYDAAFVMAAAIACLSTLAVRMLGAGFAR